MGFSSVLCDDLPPANMVLDRFDARYWKIDYPLSAISTIVSHSSDSMTLYANFRSNNDLIGLIWDTVDNEGHPLFKYLSDYDYSGVRLAFQANFPDKKNVSIALETTNGQRVVRLFPYEERNTVISISPIETKTILVPKDIGEEIPSTLISYDKSLVAPNTDSESGLDWYVIDFDRLYEGYNYDGSKINPQRIAQLFISITPEQYGLGASARLRDEGNTEKGRPNTIKKITIENVSKDLILTKNDLITITFNTPIYEASKKGLAITGWNFNSVDFAVGKDIEGLGTTARTLPLAEPIDAIWWGGRASAVTLQKQSPIGDIPLTIKFKNMRVTGDRKTIPMRWYPQSPHSMQMTSGFDDTYNITPWRQVEQVYQLGYRGRWVTYIGMSHYFKAHGARKNNDFITILDEGGDNPLNTPTVKHLEDLFNRLKEKNYEFVWSTSYEILDSYMPQDWKQLNADGNPALSGWAPPSSFIIPTHEAPLKYLGKVISQGMDLLNAAGLPKLFQIGEPWWWDGSYTNNMPCIYDNHTRSLYKQETGKEVPTPYIRDYTVPVTENQRPYFEWLGDKLGRSTNYIRDFVKARHPDSLATLLFFTPQIMTPSSEMLPIINFPKEYWKYPEYDFMQMEDYDWLINNELDLNPLTYEAVEVLGYPNEVVDYFLGFVLTPQETWVWPNVDIVAKRAKRKGFHSLFVWAYSQAMRDGILYSDQDEDEIEVIWPISDRLLKNTEDLTVTPVFLFSIGADVRLCSGTHKIIHDNETWFPVGEFGGIKTINEDVNMSSKYWQASLTGINPNTLANEGIDDYKGETCEIWLSLNSNVNPIKIVSGVISAQNMKVEKGFAEVTMTISNPFAKGTQHSSRRYTDADQNFKFKNDKGLEFVARMASHKLDWGS